MGTQAGVARKHPQSTYEGLQKSVRHEWEFVQRVTLGIGYAFGSSEKSLWETFLPAIFEGLGEGAPGRGVTRLPVKQAGQDLPDPTLMAPENCTASCVITVHLVAISGARWSSGRRTTRPASKRDGRRFGSGAPIGRRSTWQ